MFKKAFDIITEQNGVMIIRNNPNLTKNVFWFDETDETDETATESEGENSMSWTITALP